MKEQEGDPRRSHGSSIARDENQKGSNVTETSKDAGGLLAGLANLFEPQNIAGFLEEDEPDYELIGAGTGTITVDVWIDELDSLQDAHSRQIIKRAKKLRCTFDAVDFSPEGDVSANCRVPEGVYEVFLSLDFTGFGFGGGCTCARSHDEEPCEHTYRLARYLVAELTDRSSPLRSQIAGGYAVESQPDAIAYTPAILEELDHFISTRPDPQDDDYDSDESEATRLAWRLDANHNGLQLVPLKQRPKKRGGGWTKGQRVALDTLRNSPELINSPADQKVVAAMRTQASYGYSYQTKLVFDIVEAIDALVGHDQVFVDDETVEVRRFSFGIRVVEESGRVCLTIAFPVEPNEGLRLSLYGHGIVARSDSRPVVWVCRCDHAQSELARTLVDHMPYPRERLDDLRQRLLKIRETTPVELPPSLAGPIVPADTTPVALLRSRRQGHLECGMA